MAFIHMKFKGRTTSPWHVGKRRYGDYHYTREDYLWGRGVRGPVLRQLWRTYCPRSDAHEHVDFTSDRDCPHCVNAVDCPFYNLIGSADEGEFKDKPHLIITNLRFSGRVEKRRLALAALDDRYRGVVEGRAPVFVEYLYEGASFEFEAILMGEGARFAGEFESAVKTSLRFFGWGGFCNEGFGRGEITDVERNGFKVFDHKYIEVYAERVLHRLNRVKTLTFKIEPILMLDRDIGSFYTSVYEEGFLRKLCNCINERFWQFYGEHVHVQGWVEDVSGRARTVSMKAWSRTHRRPKTFKGIGNELTLHLNGSLGLVEAKAFALARYGVGRYKNQGFGSLRVHLKEMKAFGTNCTCT